ncbi:phosphatidate cytidylyltransferase [Leucobacter soli]|uniref:phosphatidate cytidylyltransferase n=1 Tax=Leucobacter soli TaxID=2812850 RepID=UPI003609DC73
MSEPDRDEDARSELRAQFDEARAHFDEARAHFEATNARIEQRAGRNLFLAIGSGLIFAAAFLASLFIVKQVFAVLVVLLVAVALVELAAAFRVAGRRVPRAGVVVGGLIITSGAFFLGAEGMLLGLFAGSLLLTLWRLIEGLLPAWEVPPKTLIRDVFSGLFTLVYVAFLASFAILLLDAPRGEWWVFALVLVVVSVDVGAYAAGVTLGRHKMTPRISPNKTWEGFAGAAVAAVLAGVVISLTGLQQPWWVGVVLGAVVLLTATGET